MRFWGRFLFVVFAGLVVLLPAAVARDDEEAMFELLTGLMLTHQGDYQTVIGSLFSIGREKKDPRLLQAAAEYARQHADETQALIITEYWVKYADDAESKQSLAQLYMRGGRYDDGAQIYRQLLADDAIEITKVLGALLTIPDQRTRLQWAQKLLNENDGQRVWQVRMAMSVKDFAAARRGLQGFDNPQHWQAVFLRAQILQIENPNAQVLAVLDDYVAADCYGQATHCTQPAVLFAYAYFLNRREGEIDDILNAPTANTDEWVLQGGQLLEELGQPAQALAYYRQIPDVFMAQYLGARIIETTDGVAPALAMLSDAAAGNNRELVLREAAIATLLEKSGRLDEALVRLQRAQITVPDNFRLMYSYSLILERMGNIDASLASLRKITRLFPDNSDGWNALGYVMADKGEGVDLQKARDYILRALEQSPDEPNYIDSLGWVNYRLGDLKSALTQLRRAHRISGSGSPEIAAHLGEVLWESGKQEEAKAVWAKAKQQHPDNEVLNETLRRYQLSF